VTKFYAGLVQEARHIFQLTRDDVEQWLKAALHPLNRQIKEHEQVLAKRIENFRKIRANIGSVEERIRELKKLRVALNQQSAVLNDIKARLDGEPVPGQAVAREPEAVTA
jgi:phage shock protein A